jgi:hypothetical protein
VTDTRRELCRIESRINSIDHHEALSRKGQCILAGCSKRLSSKAAAESKPEAYFFSPAHPKLPRQLVLREGYVEDAFKGRTPLAAFFSTRLKEGYDLAL